MAATPGRLTISDALVEALVRDQFPDLAGEEIGRHYTLADRTVVRIGDHHGVHLPTVPGLDAYYERSARLVARFREHWTFPYGAPIATGNPGHGYPYHFELTQWIDGSTAGMVPLLTPEAALLGDALRQIHLPTDSPLRNPTTSVPLTTFLATFDHHLAKVSARTGPGGRSLDADGIDAIWRAGVMEEPDELTWTHGNIEPRSVLSDQGRFAGLVDWRHFAPGDPAADLGPTLMLLPLESHQDLFDEYGPISAATRRRASSAMALVCVIHLSRDEPFAANLAWQRFAELGLLKEA